MITLMGNNPLVEANKKEKKTSPWERWFVKFWLRTRGKNTMPVIAIVSRTQLQVIKRNVALRGIVTILKQVDPELYQELLDVDFKIQNKK